MRPATQILAAALWALAWLPGAAGASGPPQAGAVPSAASAARSALALQLGWGQPEGEPVKCGLPLALHALAARTSASPALEALISRVLSREERQTRRSRGFFTVHYDTAGAGAAALLDARFQRIPGSADAFADSVLAAANAVYALEVGVLGYDAPPADGTAGGGPDYDIYVAPLGNEYGETTPETPLDGGRDGGRFVTYMTVHNDFSFVGTDSLKGIPALKVTLAHEFHHAIQLGGYGYWTNQVYFHELTSTWMETVAYPAFPDYLHYLRASWGHFRNPATPFTSNDIIMYSRGIWATFLTARFAPDIMREVWQQIRLQAPLQANDTVLRRYGSSMRLAFAEWALWNYFTQRRADPEHYYPLGALYPPVASAGVTLTGTEQRNVGGSLPPLAADYHDVTSTGDTSSLIVANLNDGAALAFPVPQYAYSLAVATERPDDTFQQAGPGVYFRPSFADPSNWKVWAAAGGRPLTFDTEEARPFPNPFLADGSSRVSLPGPGPSAELRIYDGAMQLVYEGRQSADRIMGTGGFRSGYLWDGRTRENRVAASGVYFYTIEAGTRVIKGKFALLRKGP